MKKSKKILLKWAATYGEDEYDVRASMYNEDMMMEFANKQKEDFTLKQFFDTLNSIGNIPVSLGKWEMIGDGSQIQKIQNSFKTIDY